jgi:Rieske Fe-S protein
MERAIARRQFLQECGMACASLLAAPLLIGQQGCASMPVLHAQATSTSTVRIDVVSLATTGSVIVRCPSLRDDLFVTRNARGEWRALLMHCTHRDQPLGANANGLFCTSHGSTFDLDGHVLTAPATVPLLRYSIEEIDNELVIDVSRPITTS